MVTVESPEALECHGQPVRPHQLQRPVRCCVERKQHGGTGMVTLQLEAPVDTVGCPYFENGKETLLFENIGVGLYTVYAIDENGCVDNTPGISIEQPQPFSLYAQAIVPTNCPDSEDGTVVLNYFGGSGNSTTYSTDGMSFDANTTFDLGPGTYTFYAQDVNGCLDTLMDVDVTTPPQFVAQEELTSPSCFGDTDGATDG